MINDMVRVNNSRALLWLVVPALAACGTTPTKSNTELIRLRVLIEGGASKTASIDRPMAGQSITVHAGVKTVAATTNRAGYATALLPRYSGAATISLTGSTGCLTHVTLPTEKVTIVQCFVP